MQVEIDAGALEGVIQKIADKYLSEADSATFRMTGDSQIELALEGNYSGKGSVISDSDPFGAGDAKIVLEIAALVAGSVKALLEIKKLYFENKRTENESDFGDRLESRLVAEGLAVEKAKAIAGEFKDDIAGTLS
jgi:hypothetical protein